MEENEGSREVKRQEEGREQEIWSWGAGTDGQLGTGRLQDELLPQLLHVPSMSAAGPISFLACGGAHVLALTSGGKVFSWGRGTSGQLGHSDMVNSLHPKLVMSLNDYFISHVSAGWNHSGFVSDTGALFTCGDGSFGQLGHGDEVYGFGSGKRGQLGISNDKLNLVSLPQRIYGLEGVKIASIAANGDHSAVLSADGHLYTWGRGFCGTASVQSPRLLHTPYLFTKVAVGWNHALVLTGEEVFMLGGNHHGVLSNPDKIIPVKGIADSREVNPEKVTGLEGSRVVDIAAGAEHSAIVTENGVIKTWGWGEHGQLGLGNISDRTSPQEVSLSYKIRKAADRIEIYCGSGFTIAIRTSYRPS